MVAHGGKKLFRHKSQYVPYNYYTLRSKTEWSLYNMPLNDFRLYIKQEVKVHINDHPE